MHGVVHRAVIGEQFQCQLSPVAKTVSHPCQLGEASRVHYILLLRPAGFVVKVHGWSLVKLCKQDS